MLMKEIMFTELNVGSFSAKCFFFYSVSLFIKFEVQMKKVFIGRVKTWRLAFSSFPLVFKKFMFKK